MKLIKVGAAALNQTPIDWDNNFANIRQAIEEAKSNNVSLLCLPELCLSGYGCEDAFLSPNTRRMTRIGLNEILPLTKDIAVTVGLPVMHEGSLFNTCVLIVNGKVEGLVPKQHLAGDGLHYEPRWFKPWPKDHVTTTSFDDKQIPFGDLVFDLNGIRIGFEICEDAWAAQRPGSTLARRGVDIILNPSASHFAFDKQKIRRRLVTEGSRAFGVTYIYANLLGNEAGRAIYDGGIIISSNGNILTQSPRFSFQNVNLADAVIDIDASRTQRAQLASHIPITEEDGGRIAINFQLSEAEPEVPVIINTNWEECDHVKEEEFTRAISLGLFDYMRKTYSKGFIVSLSGGADSTVVACLVRLMADFAIKQLGITLTLEKLGLKSTNANDAIDLTRHVLTTAYQATRNSSQSTTLAASTIAKAIGAKHLYLDVDNITQQYISMIGGALGRELTWEQDDIALQNIQARVRAPGVWMLANIENKLLLSTSNRSEAAVGYATMDGDTCGGISPIAGIDKAFLRKWLVWLESIGPTNIGPINEVAAVNALVPTAELRPEDANQTDEEDLMPYEVLDAIEHEMIGLRRSPAETLSTVSVQFPQYDQSTIKIWVERFYTLWCRNQWKRERYAPGFHVDDKSLDPKTWCRYPILSGGYRRELRNL